MHFLKFILALYSNALVMKHFNSSIFKPKLLLWSWSLAFYMRCYTFAYSPLTEALHLVASIR